MKRTGSHPIDLRGKVVVITTRARCVGRAIAMALAAKGAPVAIGDIDGGLVAKTATHLSSLRELR